MQKAYGLNDADKRKLAFLYHQSSINTRYSVVEDFGNPEAEWTFVPREPHAAFPCLDARMKLYAEESLPLSVTAIEQCIEGCIRPAEITHLITVSCTGMSAPGLDLQVYEAMNLSPNIFRTSVNFMGCYAAIHALRMARMICDSTVGANVVIVATELCTLHFQKEFTIDNAASSLLFADGSAAVLVSNSIDTDKAISLQSFHSQVALRGKGDMSWEISAKGFLMTLSSYIPQLIQEDIAALVNEALQQGNIAVEDITHWAIHPGGKKILEVIQKQMHLCDCQLSYSRNVLANYGNMSSASILFVLKDMLDNMNGKPANVFGVAFGPGLTMETFIASKA
jgi:predicted naringenin-chalcone synthase